MAEKKGGRVRSNGDGALFRVPADTTKPLKHWQATVELPPGPNGERRRRFYRNKSKTALNTILKTALKELAENGDLPTRDMRVTDWVNEWFRDIATPKIRPKTANTYRGLIDREIIPAIGQIRLSKLTPSDVRRMGTGIVDRGLSPTTAAQVHRILAVALKYAEREGKVTRNVATLTDAPRKATNIVTALTVDEAEKVLRTAKQDPLFSLWAAVLLTGARQGELLGLEIERVTDSIEFSWQLQRIAWLHGCGDTCGRKRGSDCPERKITVPSDFETRYLQGGLWLTPPKTTAGFRVVPLVEPLASVLAAQIETCDYPNPHGLVWRTPSGAPIDPRDANHRWHELLKNAEVTDVRFHDGRHTTVDLLFDVGVPEDLIEEIVGHSSRHMTRAYKSRNNDRRRREAMHMVSARFLDMTAPREIAS